MSSKVIPYNVKKLDCGLYMPYMPSYPYIGCPCVGTRNDAMRYIAERVGMTLPELRAALKKRTLVLQSKP